MAHFVLCVGMHVWVPVCVKCVFERENTCVHVVCVCVSVCNIMVIFVSEGNLLRDLYNSTLKF